MAQTSIVPALKEVLDTYVERKEAEWSKNRRRLPATNDGKINATAVIDEMRAMGLRLQIHKKSGKEKALENSHVQHLHKKPELAVKLNSLGKKQGLKPLGSRSLVNIHDIRDALADCLNDLHSSFVDQQADPKVPTLPLNPAGKVSLSELASMLEERIPGMGRASIFKGLHHDDLVLEIGLIADKQAVEMPEEVISPGDETIRQRMAVQAKNAASDARSAMASRMSEAKLLEELTAANEKIQKLQAKLDSLSSEIGLMRSGVFIRGLND